jgi:hypothetical protein
MMLTCKICGELQPEARIPAETLAQIPEANRRAVEYQGNMIAFAHHLATRHGDYAQLLNGCAQTYLFHLAAKLATNSAADFGDIQTEGRRFCYWTLAERFDTPTHNQGSIVAP